MQQIVHVRRERPAAAGSIVQRALLVVAMSAGAATIAHAQRMPERAAAPLAECRSFTSESRESAAPASATNDGSAVTPAEEAVPVAASGTAPCEAAAEAAAPRSLFVPRRLRTGAYAALLGVGVGSNAVFGFHKSAPGTGDPFIPADAAAHFALMASLTQAGMTAGVAPWKSAALVTAAGVGFEFTQGRVSPNDLAANTAGVLAAWGWWKLWHPNRRDSR